MNFKQHNFLIKLHYKLLTATNDCYLRNFPHPADCRDICIGRQWSTSFVTRSFNHLSLWSSAPCIGTGSFVSLSLFPSRIFPRSVCVCLSLSHRITLVHGPAHHLPLYPNYCLHESRIKLTVNATETSTQVLKLDVLCVRIMCRRLLKNW